ncbi:MAG: type II toxin-antitoxin system HipA family toxin [Candidatus Dormibacterales bacterium]
MTTVAAVNLWGARIGAVSMEEGDAAAAFQYEPVFARSGIQVSPVAMPLRTEPYSFPALSFESFRGLPGLLADSLPDRFGNAIIDAWLASQGRSPESFNAVERLCYIGSRGMGALEFTPQRGPRAVRSKELQIEALVELASEVLTRPREFVASLKDGSRTSAVKDILLVGTSAGGARAKAVIAYNPVTQQVRSGQVNAGPGFEYWLLKFDGVSGNRDKELEDPQGYCAIEYAYASMARAAGIVMTECRLLEEGGRRHFMTKRFDRLADGGKIHMQSLAALGHYDFNQAGAHSYEQAFQLMERLGLDKSVSEQQFRRMAFNIIARNQDDHVKNIAFLMDRRGSWSLAPAFDVTYAYNPSGVWTSRHQMSMNGKRDDFTMDDFRRCASVAALKRGRAETMVAEVREAVARWPSFAAAVGVDERQAAAIGSTLRTGIGRSAKPA